MMQPVYIRRTASIHPLGNPENLPYLSAEEPDYKEIITNATLRRRMSRIVKIGVACGLKCIADIPADHIQGIITATGLGCLADTEKFLAALIDNEEQMLNPTPFIQSTFNTIGAQIALLRGIHAYNMTYVHRGLSFESALLDAMMKIEEGSDNILVGAMDEITESSYTIQQRMGLFKDVQAGEGAQFFLLSREAEEEHPVELLQIETYPEHLTEEEMTSKISSFLLRCPVSLRYIHRFRPDHYKHQCGEYPTSSAYALWKAVYELENYDESASVLVESNHHSAHHSLMLIRKTV